MKSRSYSRAGHERQHGREACQKFHINDRVDAEFSDPTHCLQRAKRESERIARRDRYHIFFGNDLHCIEDKAIVFEYDEVNAFTSDHVDRATNCRISENSRTLFRELDEENAPNLARPGW